MLQLTAFSTLLLTSLTNCNSLLQTILSTISCIVIVLPYRMAKCMISLERTSYFSWMQVTQMFAPILLQLWCQEERMARKKQNNALLAVNTGTKQHHNTNSRTVMQGFIFNFSWKTSLSEFFLRQFNMAADSAYSINHSFETVICYFTPTPIPLKHSTLPFSLNSQIQNCALHWTTKLQRTSAKLHETSLP